MGEFPFTVGLGLDGGAKGAAEDLVPETDSCEADVGAVRPYVCEMASLAFPAPCSSV